MAKLFLLFTLVPIVELWLLIEIGSAIGAIPTIAVVLITGGLGAWLARREGVRAMVEINASMARGEMPAGALLDGFTIFAGGALLLTPGVLTDFVGIALLAPPSRAVIQRWILAWVKRRIDLGAVVVSQGVVVDPPNPAPRRPADEARIIDQRFDK